MGASVDSLNRLTSQQPAGTMRIAGTLNEPASVTINGKAAAVDASNGFSGTASMGSGANVFTVVATDPAGNARTTIYDLTSAGSTQTFTYDANGNMTSDGTRTFEWDAENRLVAVTVGTHRTEFTYDGLSRRTRIVEKDNGATVRDANLFWDRTEIIEERLTTGEITRFFADGESHNGAARYLTRDHLGSIREVTDIAGAIVTRNDYDPYGRLTRDGGTEDSRYGFTSHMNHVPSGLVLALYRAYDPALGRWLNADPAGMTDGPNVHAYVANNPARYMDPLGLKVGDWWDVIANLNRAYDIGIEELNIRSGPGMRNNIEDAKRHAEWMRRTTEETNALTAWLAGVGHELQNLTEGAPLEEILMDLHNNAQGRDAGRDGRPVDPNSLQTIGGADKPYHPPSRPPQGYESYPKSAEGSCPR
jgi:RHS repeat-associated protein